VPVATGARHAPTTILRGREGARYETAAPHLLCELPWWNLVVTVWCPAPEGDFYIVDAPIYGPQGRVGRWLG
jgi:hypothetical protein